MALLYAPKVGQIVMCEFPDCFRAPEMVKTRPVIVVAPRLRGRDNLVGVVPISNSSPDPVESHHCLIPVRFLPRFMQATGGDRWAKCDMVYTFGLPRLSLIQLKRRGYDARQYDPCKVDLPVVQDIRRAVAAGLGIDASLWT